MALGAAGAVGGRGDAGHWARPRRPLAQVLTGGFSGDGKLFWCGGVNKKATVYETGKWSEVTQLEQGADVRTACLPLRVRRGV